MEESVKVRVNKLLEIFQEIFPFLKDNFILRNNMCDSNCREFSSTCCGEPCKECCSEITRPSCEFGKAVFCGSVGKVSGNTKSGDLENLLSTALGISGGAVSRLDAILKNLNEKLGTLPEDCSEGSLKTGSDGALIYNAENVVNNLEVIHRYISTIENLIEYRL